MGCGPQMVSTQKNIYNEAQVSEVCLHCKSKSLCSKKLRLGISVLVIEQSKNYQFYIIDLESSPKFNLAVFQTANDPKEFLRGPPFHFKPPLYIQKRQLLI